MKNYYLSGEGKLLSFLKFRSRLIQLTADFLRTSYYSYLKPMILILMICSISSMGYGQKKKGRNGKGNKNKDITISSCIQDMGNGMYRVNFSYNNPNNKEIIVARGLSKLVIKKNAQGSKKKITTFALNRFQPGEVENAFFVDFYDMEYVRWTLKNPGGKIKKSKADSNSAMCPEPPVIIPVYGQEGGKSDTALGLELTALAEDNAGDEPSEIVYQINNEEEVLLEIVPKMGRETQVRALLENIFDRQYSANDPLASDFVVDPQRVIDGDLATFDVFFPISRLLELNDYPDDINFIRPLYTPVSQVGITTSQGDGAMFTDQVRESYVLERNEDGTPLNFMNGQGVKIGVISDSYDKQPSSEGQSRATANVGNRDLPGTAGIGNPDFPLPVDVLKDYPYGVASDEGRAMLQLIHDVAPGAELAFSTGVLSPRDFALAIEDLANAGCDVIVDDVTYPFEPFFGEGQISEAIREFTSGANSEGHAYFTSAGNFANRGYQGVFTASTDSPVTNIEALDTAKAHVFGGSGASEDIFQAISVVPGTYMIILQWAEPLASQDNSQGATTDLDIFLVDDDGNFIVGNNRFNPDGDAAEALVFEATGIGTANILITSPTDPGPVPIRYIAFRTTSDAGTNGLEFTEYNGGAPTVSGHAMTPEAITVGAVDYRNAAAPAAQAFSSFAGTLTNDQMIMVDIAAPDGGNTTVLSVGQDIFDPLTEDSDPENQDVLPNFFGTSAAAPHVAAAYALVKSALPFWYPEGSLPVEVGVTTNLVADQLIELFKTSAIPAGSTETAGSGLINAESALQQIAAQTAVITGFNIIEEGEEGETPTPGVDTFDVEISGKYIPANASVFLGDEELEIIGEITDTQITATVLPFTGNPELTVLTNSELPGAGKSNGLNLLPDGKIAVNIVAADIDIEFGQAYEFTYSVEGLPEDMTYEDTGLPEIVFESPAVAPYPDVNSYTIFPDFGEVLTEEQEEAYQINFINGLLTVDKKDLTISPDDVSIVYGDPVNVILNYDYNTDGIEDNDDFLQTISMAHDQDFFEENTLILINKFRAVVNQEQILDLLNSGTWIASERVIQNKFRAVVNSETGNMNLLDLEVENFDNYFNIEPIGNKFRAVVNKFRAVVNGQDLLNDQIELFEPISNKFRAVVNGTGILNQNGFEDFESIFAVVDYEDGTPEGEEERTVNTVYATNLLTSLDVNAGEEPSLVFPGAFISNFSNNFNKIYNSANIVVSPANLFVQTPDIAIDYGVGITEEIINSLISPVPAEGCEVCPPSLVFDGFVYNETVQSVFADPNCDQEELPEGEVCAIVILYYFEDISTSDKYFISEADEEGLILPAGSYFIKISDPQNYLLNFGEDVGILEVKNKVLTVSGNFDGDFAVEYGDEIFPDTIDPFVTIFMTVDDELVELGEEELLEIFPDGVIPYYLIDEESEDITENRIFLNDEEPPLLPAGRYIVKISMPESNYTLVYEDPLVVRVDKKELTFNADSFQSVYGVEITEEDVKKFDDPSESNVPVLSGFAYEEDVTTIFPDGIPYIFVPFEGGTEIPLDGRLIVGFYNIRIDGEAVAELQDYTIFYQDEEETNSLEITKATLNACIANVELRDGERLFPEDIDSEITGYLLEDTQANVFPGGIITYLVELENNDLLEVTEEGLLLGEGTYTIKIKDDALVNYVVVDGLTCSSDGRLDVTQCGDATVLDFSNFTIEEGGYRFTNVAPNLEALVTVQTQVNVQSFTVDENDFPAGSDDRKQFRPTASFNITTVVPEPYLEFRIELVNAGTNSPTTDVEKLIAGVLDVDGQSGFQEYVDVSLPLEYTIDGATQIQVIENPDQGLLRINGYNDSYTDAFNGAPRVNVEVVYESVSSIIYRVGAKTNGTGNVNVPTRQYGIQFSCLNNFTNPQTSEVIFGGAFASRAAPENEGVVFPNPFRDILYLQPEVTAAGTIEVLDMTGNTRKVLSIDHETPLPIEIDMSTLPGNTYYFVRITSSGLSEVYTVFKE